MTLENKTENIDFSLKKTHPELAQRIEEHYGEDAKHLLDSSIHIAAQLDYGFDPRSHCAMSTMEGGQLKVEAGRKENNLRIFFSR